MWEIDNVCLRTELNGCGSSQFIRHNRQVDNQNISFEKVNLNKDINGSSRINSLQYV